MDRVNHHSLKNTHILPVIVISLLILLTTGCGLAPVQPTAASTLVPSPTSTPEPTATATPTETPTPTATPDRTATAVVRATATMAARLAELAPELELVGYTTDSGTLVYDKSVPMAMTVTHYSSYWPESVIDTSLKNFILHVDIRWDSTSGLAGCGIMFRSEEDLERGARYVFEIIRLSGLPGWGMAYEKFNQVQTNLVSKRPNDIIDDSPNSVNNIMLVVHGDLLQAYINGEKMREVRDSKISEGGIAFHTWQESGETTCVFKNTWVLELSPDVPLPEK